MVIYMDIQLFLKGNVASSHMYKHPQNRNISIHHLGRCRKAPFLAGTGLYILLPLQRLKTQRRHVLGNQSIYLSNLVGSWYPHSIPSTCLIQSWCKRTKTAKLIARYSFHNVSLDVNEVRLSRSRGKTTTY